MKKKRKLKVPEYRTKEEVRSHENDEEVYKIPKEKRKITDI